MNAEIIRRHPCSVKGVYFSRFCSQEEIERSQVRVVRECGRSQQTFGINVKKTRRCTAGSMTKTCWYIPWCSISKRGVSSMPEVTANLNVKSTYLMDTPALLGHISADRTGTSAQCGCRGFIFVSTIRSFSRSSTTIRWQRR